MRKIKIFSISILAVLLLVAVLPLSCVFADESVAAFDGTSVLTDLQDSTIAGKKFNIDNYPLDEDGTPELLAFTEFAFSTIHEYQQYYALYLYVYYPQGNLEDYEQNTVQMAVAYDSKGEPNAWHKFHIKLLSTDGNKVLYKFRIVDTEGQTIGSIFNRVGQTPSERRYDINSIELRPQGQLTAADYGIGGTWIYTGYSKGMHQSSMEESTLKSTITQRDTLRLDVRQTYYRGFYSNGSWFADQMSSVYFSVPNKIDEGYDKLYAIDFDAYKYLTSPMFCINKNGNLFVDEEKVYEKLMNQRGLSPDEVNKLDKITWLKWDGTIDPEYSGNPGMGDGLVSSDPGFVYRTYYNYIQHGWLKRLDTCAWVFQVSAENDYAVGRYTVMNYMNEFSAKFGRNVRGKYNSMLFSDCYYTFRNDYRSVTNGQNIGRTITADEIGELRGSSSYTNFWKWLFSNSKGEITEFCPIQKVNWTDIVDLSDDEICQTYFVAKEDVGDFKAYVKEQNAKKQAVYLFRFDIDTYFTTDLYCKDYGKCGYVAQEPVYLDFDIISLTYEKDGVETVIPVVSDPIDVVAGLQPSKDPINIDFDGMFSDMLTKILTILFGIVAVICFVLLVVGMLKYLFKRR